MKTKSFESLCRKNRKLILEATHEAEYAWKRLADSAANKEYEKEWYAKMRQYHTLRAQLLEAK